MQKNLLRLFLISCFCFTINACGNNNNSPAPNSPAIGISTLSNLPLPLDPVVSQSANTSLSSMRANVGNNTGKPLALGAYDNTTFTSSDSLLACETIDRTIESLNSLASGSLPYCITKNIGDKFSQEFPNLYDGQPHVVNAILTVNGQISKEGSSRSKVIVNRDSSNIIRELTTYICGVDGNNVAHEFAYFHQTIAEDGTFNMYFKGMDGGGQTNNGFGWHIATIDGKLKFSENTSGDTSTVTGVFVGTKTMDVKQTWIDTAHGLNNYYETHLIQKPNTMEYNGYTVFNYTDQNNQAATFSTRISSLADLIQLDPSLNIFHSDSTALGNGAGTLIANDGSSTNTFTEGWNALTLLVDNSAGQSFLDTLSQEGASPPSIPNTPLTETLTGFTGNEADDCTTSETNIPTINIEIGSVGLQCENTFQWNDFNEDNCYRMIKGN